MDNNTKLKLREAASLNDLAWTLAQERNFEALKGVEARITELLDELDKEWWNY